ncbi:prepilin-type N-terminal cleavage/methylation domain-containing protein [Candidatus Uhrbacteria bacterium]|nr:prepilin-type N-terminal cleavage/methylation domain-containing protein [Candidatus Uhrbacteria bacterium]
MSKSSRGFTLLEILVVIAIIALIGVFAAVAVNAARSKQRDATRLANIRQLQSALEDHFNEGNTYPAGELLPLGDPTTSACLGLNGFLGDCSSESAVFLRIVPGTYADGLKGDVTCGDPARKAFCYTQRAGGDKYVIHFELENALPSIGLQKGVNCAIADGMQAGVCPEE